LKRRPVFAPARAHRVALPRRQALAAFAALIVGCASLPPPPGAEIPFTEDAPFTIAGRISARRGDAGVAGHFTWVHDGERDSIDLATPLGQILARLTGDAKGVNVRLQDGRVEHATDWNELTERAFGVTIPVAGLAFWVRGVPRPAAQFTVERDGGGRVSVLRQDGWEVSYAYADAASPRPSRVDLGYPGADAIDVRVVVDPWQ
jgi:outer membrane lipoprotein LolB